MWKSTVGEESKHDKVLFCVSNYTWESKYDFLSAYSARWLDQSKGKYDLKAVRLRYLSSHPQNKMATHTASTLGIIIILTVWHRYSYKHSSYKCMHILLNTTQSYSILKNCILSVYIKATLSKDNGGHTVI